jgi:hypothetical protein
MTAIRATGSSYGGARANWLWALDALASSLFMTIVITFVPSAGTSAA